MRQALHVPIRADLLEYLLRRRFRRPDAVGGVSAEHVPARKLLAVRVRPYYIYQADYVTGTAHLRTTVEKGVEVMQALRGWTSGMAVPYFVIDAPGGGGKIPIVPNYIQSISDEQVVLRNYAGDLYVYPQVRQKKPSRRPRIAPCDSFPTHP